MKQLTLSNGQEVELKGTIAKKSTQDILTQVAKVPPVKKLDNVLVIMRDGSGSMRDKMDTNKTKAQIACEVIATELAPHMAGWEYGLLDFESQVCWRIPPGSSIQLLTTLQPMCEGGTSMLKALRTVWQYLGINANKARIILLTDGFPTDSSTEGILDASRDHKSIPIDTVGIGGMAGGAYDEKFLIALSELTGGIFSKGHSVNELAKVMLELAPENRPLLGSPK